jgi:hypothetical protein
LHHEREEPGQDLPTPPGVCSVDCLVEADAQIRRNVRLIASLATSRDGHAKRRKLVDRNGDLTAAILSYRRRSRRWPPKRAGPGDGQDPGRARRREAARESTVAIPFPQQ